MLGPSREYYNRVIFPFHDYGRKGVYLHPLRSGRNNLGLGMIASCMFCFWGSGIIFTYNEDFGSNIVLGSKYEKGVL